MQKRQTYLFSIYLALLYVSMFLNFFAFPILWYSLIVFSPFIFFLYHPRFIFKNNIYLLIFYIFLSVYFIIASSLTQNREIHKTIVNSASIISSLINGYLLNQRKVKLEIIAIPIIFFILCSFFFIFKSINPDVLFLKPSQNTRSWIAVFGTCLFYICQQKEETFRKILVWPAFCGFLISIWTLSRSGIISSGILLLGVVFCKLRTSKKNTVSLFFLIILFIPLLYPLCKNQDTYTNKVALRFVNASVKNDPRVGIASNYIKSIDSVQGILFGTKLSSASYMKEWSFNLHNSFLNFHSFMGFGSLVLIILIIIGMIRKGFQNNLLGFIGIALLLRISTDVGAFIGPMDFLLFYFLFSEVKYPPLNGAS